MLLSMCTIVWCPSKSCWCSVTCARSLSATALQRALNKCQNLCNFHKYSHTNASGLERSRTILRSLLGQDRMNDDFVVCFLPTEIGCKSLHSSVKWYAWWNFFSRRRDLVGFLFLCYLFSSEGAWEWGSLIHIAWNLWENMFSMLVCV